MREMVYPPMAAGPGTLIETGDLRIACHPLGGACLMSGDLAAAIASLSPGAPILGLGGQCDGGNFAVRIARDRALLVNEAPFDARPGWYAAGYAVSAAADQWQSFTLNGAGAAQVIAEGTAVDLDGASPSAALLFAGQSCLLLRRAGGFVIFAETPRAWALAEWLRRVVGISP